jgi:hypothetical protein
MAEMTQAEIDELIAAASAVVDRWDAPLWCNRLLDSGE